MALPSRDKFANAVVDPGSAGKSFGFFFTGLSLGAVVSPAFLGYVIDRWSVTAAFLAICAFLLLAASIPVVTRRRRYATSPTPE